MFNNIEEFVTDSPAIAEEKKRIIAKLEEMGKPEIKLIWNAIRSLENSDWVDGAPEFYKPGIPWIWWVEMVNCYAGN